MHTLEQSLSEYGEVMLRAIAEQWGVEAEGVEALPARLAAAMLDPARLASFVQGLGPQALEALAAVVAAGGAIRGHLLTQAHGEVRRLGPRAIERERPWQEPASATECLWYAGLLFRRYGRLGSYHGEVFYVPADLLERLPIAPSAPAAIVLEPVPAPGHARDDGQALILDLEALLARLRLAGSVARRPQRRPDAGLPASNALPAALLDALRERWRGSADPERLALLERLALRTRLIARRGEHLQVGAAARSWLERPPFGRQSLLFQAWLHDPSWNELWHVPTLRCDDTGWRNDPRLPRSALLDALRRCPAGWLRPADLAAALKATRPDLARPDGDYDSWYIRDAASGQYLQGFAHWDDVEGALIAHLLTRSLFWLGVVALAGEPAAAFCLTPTGRALLGLAPTPPAPPPAHISVREDSSILVPPAASAYDRVRLERLARWTGRKGESDCFQLDQEATWQALNSGVSARQIVAFLERASGRRLPARVARTLEEQAAGHGRVTLGPAILLQVADAQTLRQLTGDPELAQRLGTVVSERAVLVPEGQLTAVLARLKTLGLWPRLDGWQAPAPEPPLRPWRAPDHNKGRPPSVGSGGGGTTHSGL